MRTTTGQAFGGDQLAARMRAVLRRAAPGGSAYDSSVRIGDLEVDPASRRVRVDGELVELSRKEFDLLWLLATRPGEVVTKREMLAGVWGLAFGERRRADGRRPPELAAPQAEGENAAQPRFLHHRPRRRRPLAPPEDAC